MKETFLLVDYENVNEIDLSAIPPGVRVPFFFGASQKAVPIKFMQDAHKLGDRFIPINIEGRGKNALDFHIAFYLGEYLARTPDASCVILSRDKGFDPLLKHLSNRGLRVKRVSNYAQAFPRSSPQNVAGSTKRSIDAMQASLTWLAAMDKPKRPRKRKGLVAHLYTHFAKKIPEEELQRIVDRMLADKTLTVDGESITYHF
jgi:hypothetical protein